MQQPLRATHRRNPDFSILSAMDQIDLLSQPSVPRSASENPRKAGFHRCKFLHPHFRSRFPTGPRASRQVVTANFGTCAGRRADTQPIQSQRVAANMIAIGRASRCTPTEQTSSNPSSKSRKRDRLTGMTRLRFQAQLCLRFSQQYPPLGRLQTRHSIRTASRRLVRCRKQRSSVLAALPSANPGAP